MAVYTQDMYDKLVESISLGAREVWYGDKRVAYRSLDEMLRLKRDMEIDLGLRSESGNRYFANFSKGT
jgi:hypothetical protein